MSELQFYNQCKPIIDLIYIMNKGFRDKDYNLQVKIRDEYKEDEIFELAEQYNDVWLPLKLKMQKEEREKKSTTLTMEDLLKFKVR